MKYALIGYPLGHSMSPFIHENLFALSGAVGNYTLKEISREKLNRSVFDDLSGFNVTIPYKIEIIKLLDDIKGIAKDIKSVNTVAVSDGKLIGYNTDYEGMMYSLKSSGIKLRGRVVLCGAGGVARMMAHAAAINGCELTVIARNKQRASALAEEIENAYGIKVGLNDSKDSYDLLLNGTPAGMYPNIESLPVDESLITKCENVFDAVYNPKDTLLIKKALKNGSNVAYGMPMLVYQAAAAQKIWYGVRFNDTDISELCVKTQYELERKFNR